MNTDMDFDVPTWARCIVWIVLPLLSAAVTVGAGCWLYRWVLS